MEKVYQDETLPVKGNDRLTQSVNDLRVNGGRL